MRALFLIFIVATFAACKSKHKLTKVDTVQRDSLNIEAVSTHVYTDTTHTTTEKSDAETLIIETIERVTTYDTAHADNRVVSVSEQITRITHGKESKEATEIQTGVADSQTDSLSVEQGSESIDNTTTEETRTPAAVTIFEKARPLLIISAILFIIGFLIIKGTKQKE